MIGRADESLGDTDLPATQAREQLLSWPVPVEARPHKADGGVMVLRYAKQDPSRPLRGAERRNDKKDLKHVFDAFLALGEKDASVDKVCRFVQRFGALNVAANGIPQVAYTVSEPVREPLEWYRLYARVLAATLQAVRASTQELRIKPSDHDAMVDLVESRRRFVAPLTVIRRRPRKPNGERPLHISLAPDTRSDAERAADFRNLVTQLAGAVGSERRDRGLIALVVNYWLAVGNLRPRLVWGKSAPELVWPGSLWAAIGSQLLQRIMESGPTCAYCAHCGRRVEAGRRGRMRVAKLSQRAWCPARLECQKAKEAAHSRDYRARRRRARRQD
jgi:hypothetical protein